MTKSYHSPRKSQMKPSSKRLMLWVVLVAVIFSIGLAIGLFRTPEPPEKTVVAATSELEVARDIVLYFASADGQTLVAENRRIQDCQEEEECMKEILNALISGSQSELVPVFPAQVVVRGVTVEDSLVNVDFSQDLINAHPGGTQSELLTIYSLADTLTVNFPHLRQVQILVEGVPAETLKGHVDLRQPINPDFSLVEEGVVPIGNVNDQPADRE